MPSLRPVPDKERTAVLRPDRPEEIVTCQPLDREEARAAVSDPAAGAVLVFEGTVRNHSGPLAGIVALEYEAIPAMAGSIIRRILEETAATVPIHRAYARHRIGRVVLGDPTVIVAVGASHRDEAYRASRLIIDRLKHEAPIWKREILEDGTGRWSLGCRACDGG